jgi:LmbE family N-acetylglucosaminyl deacetylase
MTMIGVEHLIRALSFRRLNRRARLCADLATNPLVTVYPRPMVIGPDCRQSVMILAPHADDETFGMGGTIARHIAAGDEVSVVVFSDNVASVTEKNMETDAIQELRASEFHAAMAVLGVRDTHMLHLPAAAFRAHRDCPPLRALLIGKRPGVLYFPSLFDNHEEHRVVNRWVAEELSRLPVVSCLVRAYEVWSPLAANTVSDITEVVSYKQEAMKRYTSQLRMIDYMHHILGLNAYRAITAPPARYAEAFLEMPSEKYIALVTHVLSHS